MQFCDRDAIKCMHACNVALHSFSSDMYIRNQKIIIITAQYGVERDQYDH